MCVFTAALFTIAGNRTEPRRFTRGRNGAGTNTGPLKKVAPINRHAHDTRSQVRLAQRGKPDTQEVGGAGPGAGGGRPHRGTGQGQVRSPPGGGLVTKPPRGGASWRGTPPPSTRCLAGPVVAGRRCPCLGLRARRTPSPPLPSRASPVRATGREHRAGPARSGAAVTSAPAAGIRHLSPPG